MDSGYRIAKPLFSGRPASFQKSRTHLLLGVPETDVPYVREHRYTHNHLYSSRFSVFWELFLSGYTYPLAWQDGRQCDVRCS